MRFIHSEGTVPAVLSRNLARIRTVFEASPGLEPTPTFSRAAKQLAELSARTISRRRADAFIRKVEWETPGTIATLQSCAAAGHLELEREVVVDAERRSPGQRVKGDLEERISQLFSRYPYRWALPRAHSQIEFLRAVEPQLSGLRRIVICGNAGLPLAGLTLHLLMKLPVTYFDTSPRSRAIAKRALRLMRRHRLIASNGISVEAALPTSWLAHLRTPDRTLFLVTDTSYSRAAWVNALIHQGASLVLATTFDGIAALSYAPLELAELSDQSKKMLAWKLQRDSHLRDLPATVGVLRDKRRGSTSSTMLFSKTAHRNPVKLPSNLHFVRSREEATAVCRRSVNS